MMGFRCFRDICSLLAIVIYHRISHHICACYRGHIPSRHIRSCIRGDTDRLRHPILRKIRHSDTFLRLMGAARRPRLTTHPIYPPAPSFPVRHVAVTSNVRIVPRHISIPLSCPYISFHVSYIRYFLILNILNRFLGKLIRLNISHQNANTTCTQFGAARLTTSRPDSICRPDDVPAGLASSFSPRFRYAARSAFIFLHQAMATAIASSRVG